MLHVGGYVFKRAESSQEMEQIHCLNFRTFVNEIPQHADPGDGRLIDKFHNKNAYFIALRDSQLVGMISIHDQPPFSVADRLSDPAILERPGTRPLEVRLLAIEPAKRNSTLIMGLLMTVYEHARKQEYTDVFISGLEERLPMYRDLGFEPLGPPVRSGQARFVPMGVSLRQLADKNQRLVDLWNKHVRRSGCASTEPVCLLPGPVQISPGVHAAFHQPPIYHRGPEFVALFQRVRTILSEMVGGRAVALFNGSGTLANEVVAATLAAAPRQSRGVLLVNGEFGERLARQASRFGLHPRILTWPWGRAWNMDEVEAALSEEPPGSWVWGVHQESSTGVLNDLCGLVQLARGRQIRVCMDCISSLGAVPLDLREVYLATGTSGKSLGAYAGVAVVFADAAAMARLNTENVPSYLDLAATLANVGPRYTFPSPTMAALNVALADYATPESAGARYQSYASLGDAVRRQLRRIHLPPLADEGCASPVVTTFAPPEGESSGAFVARCQSWGFTLGGQSGYLAERRLVQIATMGAVTAEMCAPLFQRLGEQGQNNDHRPAACGFALSNR